MQRLNWVSFFGYATHSKGYIIYSMETKKIPVSIDVEVNEFAFQNWEKKLVEN